MNWEEVLKKRIQNKRMILFSKDDEPISELMCELDALSKEKAVRWALNLAETAVEKLEERYPDDSRPRQALDLSASWAEGKIKMWAAKPAILACHKMAGEIESSADRALCHAVGQACSTVHAKGHAIGFPIYDLTAMIRECGLQNCEERIGEKIAWYYEHLNLCESVNGL